MWFYPILLILVLLGLAGIIFLGGVYTLVLVPLLVIALGSVVFYMLWARAQAGSAGAETNATSETTQRPLPHRRRSGRGRVPTTPERLVEARRESAHTPEN
jgi:uncharacterized protein (DUF58 family)